jgi:hypothetical protein
MKSVVSSNPAQARCTRYNIMWYSLSVNCDRSMVFSAFLHQKNDITEILLKVALNTITKPIITSISPEIMILPLTCCGLLPIQDWNMHIWLKWAYTIGLYNKMKFLRGDNFLKKLLQQCYSSNMYNYPFYNL